MAQERRCRHGTFPKRRSYMRKIQAASVNLRLHTATLVPRRLTAKRRRKEREASAQTAQLILGQQLAVLARSDEPGSHARRLGFESQHTAVTTPTFGPSALAMQPVNQVVPPARHGSTLKFGEGVKYYPLRTKSHAHGRYPRRLCSSSRQRQSERARGGRGAKDYTVCFSRSLRENGGGAKDYTVCFSRSFR